MMNTKLFRAKQIEMGIPVSSFFNVEGMNKSKYYRIIKDNGKRFTVDNIIQFSKIFRMSVTEFISIFFTE